MFMPLVALCTASIPIETCWAQAVLRDEAAPEETWSLHTGGELRERFESANHPLFGLSTSARNDYLLSPARRGLNRETSAGK
jgi:hypothetical protein